MKRSMSAVVCCTDSVHCSHFPTAAGTRRGCAGRASGRGSTRRRRRGVTVLAERRGVDHDAALRPVARARGPHPGRRRAIVGVLLMRRPRRSKRRYASGVSTSVSIARAAAIVSGFPLNVPTCSYTPSSTMCHRLGRCRRLPRTESCRPAPSRGTRCRVHAEAGGDPAGRRGEPVFTSSKVGSAPSSRVSRGDREVAAGGGGRCRCSSSSAR